MRTLPRLTVVALCLSAAPAISQSLDDARLTSEVWASGLVRPTGFAFVGPEDLLVFQWNTGQVHRVTGGVQNGVVLDVTMSDGGALGMVADPSFDANGYIYVYYNAAAGADWDPWTDNRVERYRWNGSQLVEPLLLISFPYDPAQESTAHNSGTLRFGPDGMLYGQVGDKSRGAFENGRIEQNTSTTASSGMGGIFRIAPDGSIPSDNPFANHPDPLLRPWFVYGFRNSLGFDFDLLTGSIWFGENGPALWDELNRGDAGMNSGWRKIMGPDARDATFEENQFTAYDAADLTQLPGSFYRDPEFSWVDCIGVTAVMFQHSRRFPEDLWDDLIVGETNFGQIYKFELEPTRQELSLSGGLADKVADDASERDLARFGQSFGTVTHMLYGPDGYLYLTDYWTGRIHRIRPLVDLFQPLAANVQVGSPSGGLADLERSDNRRYLLGPTPGGLPNGLRRVVFEFELQASNPDQLALTVEGRANLTLGRQRIEAFNVLSDQWVTLDERALTVADQTVHLPQLSSAGDWVEPSSNSVRIRVSARAVEGFGASSHGQGAGGSARLELALDQVRLEVAWP